MSNKTEQGFSINNQNTNETVGVPIEQVEIVNTTIEQTAPVEVVNTPIEVDTTPDSKFSMSMNEMTAMFTSIMQANTVTNNQNAFLVQQQENQRKTLENNLTAGVGLASTAWADKMKQEIADGQYIDFKYSKHMATTMDSRRTFTVNGFTLQFEVGKTTKVPLSLEADVDLFIERLDVTPLKKLASMNGNSLEMSSTDAQKWEEASNGLFNK